VQLVKRDGVPGYAFLRGTGRIGEAMNKKTVHLVAGRTYRTGHRELVVGRPILAQFRGVGLGDQILIHGAPWTVVGIYQDDQGGIDGLAMAGDVDMLRADLGSPTYQSISVTLRSPADFEKFRDALTTNPQLNVQVLRLSQYYKNQTSQLRTLFDFVGYFVGGVMAVGAACGALTTLYAAVDARAREIATLRAIGFGGVSVVAAVLLEALALAIPGAVIGLAVTALAFDGHSITTGGATFAATVTPLLALAGAALAIVIGLVGGLLPALHAARRPVAEALRAT
jgi:putative ABC transport system permease protein